MSEKSEEQIAKEKAAVEAMRNAKSNMDAALARISSLEWSLGRAVDSLKQTKKYISPDVYAYSGNSSQRTVHDLIDEQIAVANKALG